MSTQLNSSVGETNEGDEKSQGFYYVLITTFSAVFFAELGDKTQIATLLLTAESGNPIVVFIGSSSALVCSSIFSVLIGRWVANKIKTERFNYLAGLLMIGIGLLLAIQSANSLTENLRSL